MAAIEQGIFKYLSVYDVALSDSEIQQIHSTGTSIINANRLLDVDFSTGSGTTLYDKTSTLITVRYMVPHG